MDDGEVPYQHFMISIIIVILTLLTIVILKGDSKHSVGKAKQFWGSPRDREQVRQVCQGGDNAVIIITLTIIIIIMNNSLNILSTINIACRKCHQDGDDNDVNITGATGEQVVGEGGGGGKELGKPPGSSDLDDDDKH